MQNYKKTREAFVMRVVLGGTLLYEGSIPENFSSNVLYSGLYRFIWQSESANPQRNRSVIIYNNDGIKISLHYRGRRLTGYSRVKKTKSSSQE